MKTVFKGARVWREDRTWMENCSVLIEDETVLSVGEAAADADTVIDAAGYSILPGLVDVHTHGRSGYDFCDATEEQMALMQRDYARRGVTSVFATLASATQSEWLRSIDRIQNCDFEGIHFEGRYLDFAKRGAHASKLLVPLNAAELGQILSRVRIPCHISAALELDADGSFSAEALAHGATLGLGHTSASAEEARTAIKRGATSFTHLFNAMPPLHHREGGAVSVALNGEGYGELIVDGIHICPDMVRLAYKCLGADRTVLITDSMSGTGCPDGNYSIAGMPVILKDGKALTTEGALAGSTLDLWNGVKNLMAFAGIPLEEAVACATLNPARMVGIDGGVGSIAPGKRADLLLVNAQNEICRVFRRGREVK